MRCDGVEWNGIVWLEGIFTDHQVWVPDHFKTNQKLKHVIEGILQIPLGTDSHEASITSLKSWFRCLTTFTVRKCFPVWCLIFPWHSFDPFPHTCHQFPGAKPSTSLSISPPQRAAESHFSNFCSPNWAARVYSASPHKRCLPDLSEARVKLVFSLAVVASTWQ